MPKRDEAGCFLSEGIILIFGGMICYDDYGILGAKGGF